MMRETVLEQVVKRSVTNRGVTRINRRISEFKAQSTWSVHYRWVKPRRHLVVQTGPLHWEARFGSKRVKIVVEGPVLLKLVMAPMKERMVALLRDELAELSK